MEKLRILQVIPKLITGGGQKVVVNLANSLDKNTFDVEILSLYPFSNELFEEFVQNKKISIDYLSKKQGVDPRIILDVMRVFKEFNPQIVHNHLYGLYTVIPASVLLNVPVRIHTIHTLASQEDIGFHGKINKLAFTKFGFMPVSVSRAVQLSIERLYGDIESPIIYNGIDLSDFTFINEDREIIRNQLNISEESFVFIIVASFTEAKNHLLLLRAFKKILNQNQKCKLLLVGDGLLKDKITTLIHELNIVDSVILLGNRQDIPQLLFCADCFVLPSSREGFPLSLLEAMAAKKPVIASCVGGIPEIINDSINGILVEPNNEQALFTAMNRIISDSSFVNNIKKNGWMTVSKNFCIETMVSNYSNLYINKFVESRK